jgi:hypothetical protein
MAADSMALVELAEKVADGNLLRELGQLVLQRLMEAEVDAPSAAIIATATVSAPSRRVWGPWT